MVVTRKQIEEMLHLVNGYGELLRSTSDVLLLKMSNHCKDTEVRPDISSLTITLNGICRMAILEEILRRCSGVNECPSQ